MGLVGGRLGFDVGLVGLASGSFWAWLGLLWARNGIENQPAEIHYRSSFEQVTTISVEMVYSQAQPLTTRKPTTNH